MLFDTLNTFASLCAGLKCNAFSHVRSSRVCWRLVQLTRSKDMMEWRPFQLISIREYAPTEGDLYFFSVQQNPVVTEI